MSFHQFLPHPNLPPVVKLGVYALYLVALAAVIAVAEHALSGRIPSSGNAVVIAVVATGWLIACYLLQHHSQAVESAHDRIEKEFKAAYKRVEDVYLQNRLTVDYYPSGGAETPEITTRMYRAASNVIERAQDGCEILAVTSFYEKFKLSDADNPAHSEYFRVLESRLPMVRYHRLVQCVDSDDLRAKISMPYDAHFRRLIELRDSGVNQLVWLDMVPPVYSTAYVIIDNPSGPAFLIWQMNEYVQTTKPRDAVFRPRGLFIITDPDRQFIQYFRAWFNRLAGSGKRRALTLDDLGSQWARLDANDG
jgi:hypothetical protein